MRCALALILAVALAGCIAGPIDTQVDGTYAYVGKRADGSIETKGTLTLRSGADTVVTGTWSLENVQGDGVLEGRRDDMKVSVDLHPGWRDHNLILMGEFKNGVITGRWQWIGFPGVMSEGTFEAKKLR